jgi:hypothetical protein
MAHSPLKITSEQAQAEIRQAWTDSYSPPAIERAVDLLAENPLWLRISMFIGRLSFRGIYFPQMGRWDWLIVAWQNRRTIFKLARAAFGAGIEARRSARKSERAGINVRVEREPERQES